MQLELPNDSTRVAWLIDNMKKFPDKDVSSALATIYLDDGEAGMRSDFERAVDFLLRTDPAKKKQRRKRGAATISEVGAPDLHNNGGRWTKGTKGTKGVTFKSSKGITGVELCYYKITEFKLLSEAQKNELKAYRNANGNYKGAWSGKYGGNQETGKYSGSKGRYLNKAQVAALLINHDA